MKMKTIRVTGIAVSIVALLLVAMAPPASAECPKLNGNYAFRLVPAKSFAPDLAAVGDPGNISGVSSQPGAGRQNVLIVGTFTAVGSTGTISVGDALATTDGGAATFNATTPFFPATWSHTWEIKFPFTGTFSCASDLTGTLTIDLGLPSTWTCTDTTTGLPVSCLGTEENSNALCTAAGTPFTCCGATAGTGTCNEMKFSISVSGTNERVELAEDDNLLPHPNGDSSTTKLFLSGEAVKE